MNPVALLYLQWRSNLTRSIALALFFLMSAAPPSLSAWTFISSPDWFNRDIADLSGLTPGVPKADGWDAHKSAGGLNGISPKMQLVYDSIIAEMAAYSPEVFVVTGDLVNGYWFNDETLEMFDPVTPTRSEAIDKAADIYYGWYRWLFNSHGIAPVLAAVGDHEIGGDDWQPGTEWSHHVQEMKSAFGRNMVDTLGLPDKINGANARPYGTSYEQGSYAYQHRNLLLVTVDVFRQDDPDILIHAINGSVSPDINGAHLDWLRAMLIAADADVSIDHVIIQGHAPVLRPVRMQTTSGLMFVNREDSDFWALLRQHDHRNGGKVRLYFGGEVHAVTVSKDTDSDLIQFVHGSPPIKQVPGNYVVFQIHPDRIEAELRRFPLTVDGSSWHWRPSQPESSGVSSVDFSTHAGSLVIDTSTSETRYTTSGDLALVDQKGLTMHFDFDQITASGNFSNRGSIGNDFYEGVAIGSVASVPDGMFGSAIQLNGDPDSPEYVESGRGNITEGESRFVSSWVKTTSSGRRGIFNYGRDKSGSSINGRFVFQLKGGRPQLAISRHNRCLLDDTSQASTVNDGQWHHVAVVLTDKHHNSCADVRFYVDGAEFAAKPFAEIPNDACKPSDPASCSLDTLSWTNIRIGAGQEGRDLGKSPDDFFNGAIDDVAMFGSPLTASKARAIERVGRDAELRYDASAIDLLFELFDSQQGFVTIGNQRWVYTQGLNGAGGDVLNPGGRIAIQLDNLGNGVIEPPAGTIQVVKTAAPETLTEPGGLVTYTIIVNNTSIARSVTIDTLTDNVYGDLNGEGTCFVPQTIAIGGHYMCTFSMTVNGKAGDSETDTVTANGSDDDGNPVSHSDSATVTISRSQSTSGCFPYTPSNGKYYLICW